MALETGTLVRLSAQTALLGAVTPNLRSFSVEVTDGVVRTLAVYAADPSEHEKELIQVAATEIIADFIDETLDEQIIVSASPIITQLEFEIYRRHEP